MTVVDLDALRIPPGYVLRELPSAHVTARLRAEGRTLRLYCRRCDWGAWVANRAEAAQLARRHDQRKHKEETE